MYGNGEGCTKDPEKQEQYKKKALELQDEFKNAKSFNINRDERGRPV